MTKCRHCPEDVTIAHPTGSGWVYKHDPGGYTLCIVNGTRPGTHAEPAIDLSATGQAHMTAFGWTRIDADIPTYDLGADSSFYVEQWGLGSWAAYHNDQRIGEPGQVYGTSDEAKIAAELAYMVENHAMPSGDYETDGLVRCYLAGSLDEDGLSWLHEELTERQAGVVTP